ncbi:hypothetical protein JOC70_003397 [Clostridium pascui]|uniref:hypothetical protein n=1 Tax=Clostridium pascui TaxID=46609 RepID=UPI0019561AFA|nr:hypothetical protein [Clostridium pascui]MBM7871885.1 hypothetical protein [Clostridium pascui]
MRDKFYKVYFKLIQVDENKAISILNRISTDKIFHNLIKVCWKNNIQYRVVLKNNEILMMYLEGKEDSVFFNFSKEKMIFEETFECFLTQALKYNAKKSIFITMGIFENKIIKSPTLVIHRNIKLIDRYTFIRHQVGLSGDIFNSLKENNFKFYRYLPIY